MACGRPGSTQGRRSPPTASNSGARRLRRRHSVRTLLRPTLYRYPAGFCICCMRSQCSHPQARAAAVASRPSSRPKATHRARRNRGSASSKNSANEAVRFVSTAMRPTLHGHRAIRDANPRQVSGNPMPDTRRGWGDFPHDPDASNAAGECDRGTVKRSLRAASLLSRLSVAGVDTVFGMVGHSNLGPADALRRARRTAGSRTSAFVTRGLERSQLQRTPNSPGDLLPVFRSRGLVPPISSPVCGMRRSTGFRSWL